MDFARSPKADDTCERMWDFMRERVFPAEPVYQQSRATNDPHGYPPVMEELKAEASADCGTSSFPHCRG